MLAMITVYCTAMIYASLKSVQAWHTPLTPACYLLFSASGGFVAGAAFAAAGGADGLGLLLALALRFPGRCLDRQVFLVAAARAR